MTRQHSITSRAYLMMAGALLLFSGGQAKAAEGDTTTITVNGTLIDGPQCVIDGNNTVDVKFGDDLITRLVDGVNYKKEIQYGLTCTGLNSNALKLTIRGALASFGSGLLRGPGHTAVQRKCRHHAHDSRQLCQLQWHSQ